MATTFKSFLSNDITSTRTLLHESIPITGSILSGTYNEAGKSTENNIKDFSHGLFQSVYDYPFLSSSANHIFDLTIGYSNTSGLSASANTQNKEKIQMYNQMAQVLMGHDASGSIREFDEDGDLSSGGTKLKEVFFVNFARLLQKDEIKKGTFAMEFGVSGSATGASTGSLSPVTNFGFRVRAMDLSGSTSYLVNSPVGDYGILYLTSSLQGTQYVANEESACGLIFYQAGIAVISGSIFSDTGKGGLLKTTTTFTDGHIGLAEQLNKTAGNTGFYFVTGSSISGSCNALRNRIYNISFNNTTELNSTVYFCRASHNEFNYSSNPTYLSGSKIVVKEVGLDQPVSYITTVGLYSANNELLAVAKTSEPLQKTPDNELVLRVRLDY
tara:strand:+ start:111 stop:1265 length:1155 start_codon:yes stop_codon:yes gene_type:complete